MEFLKRLKGFPQRHYGTTGMSPFMYGIKEHLPFDLPYHRSAVTMKLIREDILAFNNTSVMPSSETLKRAIARTRRDFKIADKVKMIHLNDIFNINDLQIWGSSPGLPWKEHGYKTKRDIKNDPEAIRRVRKFWHLVKGGRPMKPPDSMAYVRSHLAPVGEDKIRAIWGYPATMTFGEAVFAIPLIRAYKKQSLGKIAYGYETAVGGFKRLFARFGEYKHYVTMDFKSFDKTVPAWLIEKAFDILLDNINLEDYEDYGYASVKKMIRMWEFIKNYFIHTTIRMCDGERFRKHSGVASGSYFTQLIDSVVNAILLNWCFLELQGEFPRDYVVMGDDSLVACDHPINFDDAQDLYDVIGMTINIQKSAQSRNIHALSFMGYQINFCRPFKEEKELFAALLFPERPDEILADVQNRALGLLYAGLGTHARFHAFCEVIIKIQPFDLRLPPSINRMLNIVLGIKDVSCTPPDPIEFLKNMIM